MSETTREAQAQDSVDGWWSGPRELPSEPRPLYKLPTGKPSADDIVLEEYRALVEERRFVMTRYTQAIGLYLALVAFLVSRLGDLQTGREAVIVVSAFTLLNAWGLYAAWWFRKMAYHALNRETILAEHLGVQWPPPMKWGDYGGVLLITLCELAVVALAAQRFLGP